MINIKETIRGIQYNENANTIIQFNLSYSNFMQKNTFYIKMKA